MSYILKLAGWYPSRVDEFTGDFVQRHARAISLYEKIIVLFLVKDPSLSKGQIDIRTSTSGNLTEYIVYYSTGGPFERARSLLYYLSLGQKIVRQIIKEHGPPALVHVSIVWKAGLLALRLKKRFGWNYLLTEHWAGYTKDNPHGLHTRGRLVQRLYKKVYAGAALFLPVSAELARQVQKWFPCPPVEVVSNVVDTDLFHYPSAPQKNRPWRLIHVAGMGYQKNTAGLIRTFEKLTAGRDDIEITLVGAYPPEIHQTLTKNNLLGKTVFLTGNLPHTDVARLMRQSHLFILFSRYENQPCVILEALCCGLPVVATRIGGIPEVINTENGLLVDSEDETQLLVALNNLLDNYSNYNRPAIAASAAQSFSYPVVGRRITQIYSRFQKGQNPKNSPASPPNSGLPPSP